MLDVFRERIGEVKEWVQESCRNGSVRDAPSGRDTALGVLLVDN